MRLLKPGAIWASALQPPVLDRPEQLAIQLGRVCLLDDQRAGQATAHLHQAVVVRVVPEGAGIGRGEGVVEATARAGSVFWVRPGTPSIAFGRRMPCQ